MSLPIVRLPEPQFLPGWTKRKIKPIASTVPFNKAKVYFNVHSIEGEDTTSDVYIGNVRADWGDLRITTGDGLTALPFELIVVDLTQAKICVPVDVIDGIVNIFLYYSGPAASTYEILNITDIHYDPGSSLADRDQALVHLANAADSSIDEPPNLVIINGDMTGASSAVEATQLAWLQSVIDTRNNFQATDGVKTGVAMGNHDFEYMSKANVLAKFAHEAWMEPSEFYGPFLETSDFVFISLDSNFIPGTQNHESLTHKGSGYINTDQIAWLKATLAASEKPCIIYCHHPLSEMDTDQFTLTKEIYHTSNRQAVRRVLEESQKVICCVHGHVHRFRSDVINGIPYLTAQDIGNDGNFGELPLAMEGHWSRITFDSTSKTIRFRRVGKIGSDFVTVYDTTLPFGRTSFSTDVGENPDECYSSNYNGAQERACFLRDATQLIVSNDDYLYKFPANLHTPDPYLSNKTIRIQGRTNNPNFGRCYWVFDTFSKKFRLKLFVHLSALSTKIFKLGDANVVGSPCIELRFKPDGNVTLFDGAVETVLQAYLAATWYEVDLEGDIEAQTHSLYLDGVLLAENFSFANAVAFVRQLEIITEQGDLFIDQGHIFEYVTPEPALGAWGAVEISEAA